MCGCVSKPAGESDPFALPKGISGEPTEVWRFIINSEAPQPAGTDESYTSVSRFETEMNEVEMAILRYFHSEGIDFMSVSGSLVSISDESVNAFISRCMCHKPQMQAVMFVRQTRENLEKIKVLVAGFGDNVKAEMVDIVDEPAKPLTSH